MKRDRLGNFAKGNKEGKKFQPGNSGKPKDTRHKKRIAAKKFAEEQKPPAFTEGLIQF